MLAYRRSLIVVSVLSILVAVMSWRFLGLGQQLAFPAMAHQILNAPAAFLAHVIASPVALFCGAFQFYPKLRSRRPALHRWTGRIYAAAIAVGSVSGLLIAIEVPGMVGASGFFLLAIAWAVTTGRAVMLARARQFGDHRRWMIRSFALTFAAVTLRIQLLIFALLGSGYYETYPFLAWSCWLPNLIFAEWWIRREQVAVAKG